MTLASNEHLLPSPTPPHANVFKWTSTGYFSFSSLTGRGRVIVFPLPLGLRFRKNLLNEGEETFVFQR